MVLIPTEYLSNGISKNAFKLLAKKNVSLADIDYIYRRDFGAAFQKGMYGNPDKIDDKGIIKCLEKMAG